MANTFSRAFLAGTLALCSCIEFVGDDGRNNPADASSRTTDGRTRLQSANNLQATTTFADHILLTWEAVAQADGYRVYWSSDANGTFALLGDAGSSTQYVDTGLAAGVARYYTVVAYAGAFADSLSTSAVRGETSNLPVLDAPVSLTASTDQAAQINLTWAATPNATSYQILSSNLSAGPFVQVNTTSTPTYADSGLEQSQVRFYQVVARASGYTDSVPAGPARGATTGPRVCVGGQTTDFVAAYWVNGELTKVGGAGTFAKAVAADSSSVYMVGKSGGYPETYYYWKDATTTQPLVLGAGSWNINSPSTIVVSGGDVYIGGQAGVSCGAPNYDCLPAFLKNGALNFLNLNASYTSAWETVDGLFVSGASVYVLAGYFVPPSTSKESYWLNTTENLLPSGGSGIFVDGGGTVYVANSCSGNSKAGYWKSGGPGETCMNTSTSSQANAIYVANGHVYLAGHYWNTSGGYNVAAYWTDTTLTTLGTGTVGSDATGIVVLGTDIYVSGTEYVSGEAPGAYWKNGKKYSLPLANMASGIAVTP